MWVFRPIGEGGASIWQVHPVGSMSGCVVAAGREGRRPNKCSGSQGHYLYKSALTPPRECLNGRGVLPVQSRLASQSDRNR